MKIKKVESFVYPNVGLVRLTTDSGQTGWGQIATYEAADIVASCLHRQVSPVVLGRDPDDYDRILDDISIKNLKFPGSHICRALAAIDTALIDLNAKRAGVPAWSLLGGNGDPVPVYGSSMSRSVTSKEEAARMCGLRDRNGFKAFKLRVGGSAARNDDAWPGRTEEIIPAVRKALGDGIVIHADANSCYTPPRALVVGRMLEDNGYGHFEEPCPYWEYDWTRQVTEKLRIPVAGGEQDNYLPAWKHMIRDHVVDIAQPDICYIGGVRRTLQVARWAADYGMQCTPHAANHSLVSVFTLHVRSAMPTPGPYMELSIEDQTQYRNMFSPSLEVADGCVRLPAEGPGWGVTINDGWLKGATWEVSDLKS